MGCTAWQEKLGTYLDAELPAEEMSAFGRHLRACPACAADTVERMQLKRATRSAGVMRYTARSEFRQKIERSIASKKSRRWSGGWLPGLATAAILLLAAFVSFSIWMRSTRGLGELADLHVATLASANPVDVISTDSHTVKPWFAGKLPFSFNLPELKDTGFTLLGGRVTYFHQTPGAQLLFAVRKHKISVFIFQDRPEVNRWFYVSNSASNKFSFNEKSWSEGGLQFFSITDASPDDLVKLSQLLRGAELKTNTLRLP